MDKRTPNEKYGTHLCRRLLETYDGCDAGVRGASITLTEADAYVERLVTDRAVLLEALEHIEACMDGKQAMRDLARAAIAQAKEKSA